jgi:hypothetical protein
MVASFLVKLNSSGSVDWAKRVPGEIRKIDVFPNGEIVVVGEYRNNIQFEGNNLTNKGGYDIYMARYANNGSFRWVKAYGGSGDDHITDLFLSDNYTSVIAGQTSSSDLKFSQDDQISSGAFVVKFDVNDYLLWSKSFTNSIYINAITGKKNGSQIALTGYISSSTNFGCGNYTNIGGKNDIFLAVLNSDGSCYVVKVFGGSGNDKGNSISYLGDNYLVVGGDYEDGTIEFDNGISITSRGSSDIFVFKYNPVANKVIWAKSFGGSLMESSVSIASNFTGDIILTGYFDTDGINFGGGNLKNAGSSDVFIVKLDQDGNHIFSRGIGGNEFEIGTVVKSDYSNNTIVSGKFGSSSITIDDITLNNANGIGMNVFDIFLIKLTY